MHQKQPRPSHPSPTPQRQPPQSLGLRHKPAKSCNMQNSKECLWIGIAPQCADPPPSFLYTWRRHVKIIWTRKLPPTSPTGIGDRYWQTISNLGHAELLRRFWTPPVNESADGDPLVNSLLWALHPYSFDLVAMNNHKVIEDIDFLGFAIYIVWL